MVDAARNGLIPLHELTPDELAMFHTAVDDAIARRIATIDWHAMLSRRGLYSVAMDEHGQIVVCSPDAPAAEADADPNEQDDAGEKF